MPRRVVVYPVTVEGVYLGLKQVGENRGLYTGYSSDIGDDDATVEATVARAMSRACPRFSIKHPKVVERVALITNHFQEEIESACDLFLLYEWEAPLRATGEMAEAEPFPKTELPKLMNPAERESLELIFGGQRRHWGCFYEDVNLRVLAKPLVDLGPL